MIGSSLAATCTAMAAIVEKNGPLQYCLSPIIRGAPGGYVYSASAGSDSIAAVIARFYRQHGWTSIALITSTDASGVGLREAVRHRAGAAGKPIDATRRPRALRRADLSVARADGAHQSGRRRKRSITFATGTPLGTLLHGYHDAGLDIPVTASGGNMIYEQMAQYAASRPRKLYFAATRGVAPDANLRPGPIMDAQNVVLQSVQSGEIRPDFAIEPRVGSGYRSSSTALRKIGTGRDGRATARVGLKTCIAGPASTASTISAINSSAASAKMRIVDVSLGTAREHVRGRRAAPPEI